MTLAPEPTAVESTERWMADHSWSRPNWTLAELEAAKAGRTISVVLPALNEEETVGTVVRSIVPMLGGLVDELIVLDSGSTDDTELEAMTAGARVITREQAVPEVAPQPGKGEVLWRSLAVATGDIIVTGTKFNTAVQDTPLPNSPGWETRAALPVRVPPPVPRGQSSRQTSAGTRKCRGFVIRCWA